MKIFTEEQRFNQWWLFVILAIAGVAMLYPLIAGEVGSDKSLRISLLITFGIYFLVVLFILSVRLFTQIDETGIHYQFGPIHRSRRHVPWQDITYGAVVKYNPILDYGGWGYRSGFLKKKGKAYNIKGNLGIKMELKNGKKILIGTQKPEEAKRVLDSYKHKIT